VKQDEREKLATLVAEKIQETFICPHGVSDDNVTDMKEFLHEDRSRLRQFLDTREEMYKNIRKVATVMFVSAVCILVVWGLVAYIRVFPPTG